MNSEQIFQRIQNEGVLAIDFIKEQVPQLVEQILYWGLVNAAIWIVLSLASLFVFKSAFAHQFQDEDAGQCIRGFAVGGTGVSIGVIILNVITVLKIIVAPKLYLLVYFSAATHLN